MVEAIGVSELYNCLRKWLEYCLSNGGHSAFDPHAISDAGNKRLKLNNLKHVQRRILEYYSGTLHISLDKYPPLDITRIAEQGSEVDLARLLQLVLGIAIHCDGKEQYIQDIMGMDQEVQHVVMGAIQQLMTLESPSVVAGEEYKELEEEHRQVTAEGNLRSVVEEKSDLVSELENVRAQLKEAQSSFSDSTAAKVQQLHRQFEAAKLDKLQRDDLKAHTRELEAQVEGFQQKIQELTAANEEIPILKDSLEEMKYLDSKVKNYETVINQYKKKLGKRNVDAIAMMCCHGIRGCAGDEEADEGSGREEYCISATKHGSGGGTTEDTATHQQKWRSISKGCVGGKCGEGSGLSSQEAEDKSLELEGVRAELMRVQKERDTLQNVALGESLGAYVPQAEMLPDTIQPSADQSQGIMSLEGTSAVTDHPDLGFVEAFTPELKEKMAKLEKENEILLRRLEVGNPLNTAARSEDIVAKMHVDQLRAESLLSSEKLATLESANKELKLQLANVEVMKQTRDAEIEKYKKYLNKAKTIIEGFGDKSKSSVDNSAEMQNLKTQLIDRERQIEKLQKANEQDRLSWAKEEEMILSAWYQLGLKMHQKYSQERVMSQGSFLAQQREALYKRPPPVVSATVNTPG
eukprot:Em0011g388a